MEDITTSMLRHAYALKLNPSRMPMENALTVCCLITLTRCQEDAKAAQKTLSMILPKQPVCHALPINPFHWVLSALAANLDSHSTTKPRDVSARLTSLTLMAINAMSAMLLISGTLRLLDARLAPMEQSSIHKLVNATTALLTSQLFYQDSVSAAPLELL